MAYAALNSVTQILDRILHQPDRYSSVPFDKLPVESLYKNFSFLLGFLDECSQNVRSQALVCLETKIRDVTFKAEDIIESHIRLSRLHLGAESSSRKLEANSGTDETDSVEDEAVKLSGLRLKRSFRFEDVEKFMEEIDSIKEEASMFEHMHVNKNPRRWTSFPSSGDGLRRAQRGSKPIVGFDNDLIQIKGRLMGDNFDFQIIPIVGMGGIGKTTLAERVYDDSQIRNHFDKRAWMTVSQNYDVREMVLGLLSCLVAEQRKYHESNEQLGEYLYKRLKGWRYLIVMDDIWSTEAWDGVQRYLPDDGKGSRILLTTRLMDVADYVNPCIPHHQMNFLNEDQGWDLLRDTVFPDGNCPLELEGIGKEIARNCQGLPLAISVIGGLLSKDDSGQDFWQHVARNVNELANTNAKQCLEILRLSYDHLPHHLKACFLYMGFLPQNHGIRVTKLVNLWAAEGFLRLDRSKTTEQVAEECIQDLINRNLILAGGKGSNGKVRSCRIHDLLRDLCIKICHDEKFFYVLDKELHPITEQLATSRRVVIHKTGYDARDGNDTENTESLDDDDGFVNLSSVRSFVDFSYFNPIMESLKSCNYFPSILQRVFDAAGVTFNKFPEQILQLVNLRYVAFICNAKIPPSISSLKDLQTLIVCETQSSLEIFHYLSSESCKYHAPSTLMAGLSSEQTPTQDDIPSTIWEMPQLKYVQFLGASLPDPIHKVNSSVLENLETLSGIRNLKLTDEVLRRLPNLKKLKIFYDENFTSATSDLSDASLHNLVNIYKLEVLKIVFRVEVGQSVLRSFALPTSLRKLTLSGGRIPWDYMTRIGSLPDLEVLKLKDNAFRGSKWEPLEYEFCELKFLLLTNLDMVKWRAESCHFPCLQCLIVQHCHKLREIPSGIGEIPSLKLINVSYCRASTMASVIRIQKEQEEMGNDALQIRVSNNYNCFLLRVIWKLSRMLVYALCCPPPVALFAAGELLLE